MAGRGPTRRQSARRAGGDLGLVADTQHPDLRGIDAGFGQHLAHDAAQFEARLQRPAPMVDFAFGPVVTAASRRKRRSRARGMVFERLQAAVEIARLDRPQQRVHDARDGFRLARGQRALGDRSGDRARRTGDVRSAGDRRQGEFDGALAARRENALETEAQRGRIAGLGQLNRAPPRGLPDCPLRNGRPTGIPSGRNFRS